MQLLVSLFFVIQYRRTVWRCGGHLRWIPSVVQEVGKPFSQACQDSDCRFDTIFLTSPHPLSFRKLKRNTCTMSAFIVDFKQNMRLATANYKGDFAHLLRWQLHIILRSLLQWLANAILIATIGNTDELSNGPAYVGVALFPVGSRPSMKATINSSVLFLI